MFRRRSTTLAAALLAAALVLAPGKAQAQVGFLPGGGGVYYTGPNYVAPAYRSSYLYYQYGLPYNPLVNNPQLYGTPAVVGVTGGTMGLGTAGPASTNGSYLGTGGLTGYGNVFTPYAGTPNFYRPLLGYSGYGSAVAPFDTGVGIPSYAGYPSYLYPYFGSFNEIFPSYVYTGNYVSPLQGSYSGLPLTTPPALSLAGLSTVPFTPGIDLTAVLSPMRTSTGFPVISPQGVRGASSEAAPPRIRPAMYPAIAATAGASFGKVKPAAGGSAEPAAVEVKVPQADAELWFQGVKTNRTGKVREFASPALDRGTTYSYQVRARWMDNGEPVERTRSVTVRAGERVRVDFTADK
jgi:uncharacterized protein (TIGR03000 family)